MFSLLISVTSVLPGRSVSVLLPLCDLTEIYMSKCLFVSHDIMTTFGYWGGFFFGPYYFSSCENLRKSQESKGVSNSTVLIVDKARVTDTVDTQIRVKAKGQRKINRGEKVTN